jgi:hypothetical protein
MSETFFERIRRLDELINAGPTACNYAQDLADLLSETALNDYFFQKISDPSWLKILDEAGQFKDAPRPREDKSEGVIAFPSWPQGEYLKRIASGPSSQDAICDVLNRMPLTENPRVADTIVDIALQIRPALSVRLTPRIVAAIQSRYHIMMHIKVGALISYLAKSGEIESALQLAEAALEILPDPRRREREDEESAFYNLREPTARFDAWGYEQLLGKNVPDLVDAGKQRTLDLLCDLLDRAILLSDRRGEARRPEDLSYVWRPSIEDHQQNLNMGLKPLLVTAVRNAAEQIAKKDVQSLPTLVAGLEKRSEAWGVFRRIALHLLRAFPEAGQDLIRTELLDRGNFDSVDMRHEYFLLEKDYFGKLPTEDQEVILGWIEAGLPSPMLDRVMKNFEEITGKPPSKEERERYNLQWKRERIAPLEEHLTALWREAHSELFAEEGRPQHPEFTTFSERAWGPTSPQSGQELGAMSPPDLVKYLADWRPSGDVFRGPTSEGLGREVTSIITGKPEAYAASATDFKRLGEPTYVRAVIQGFEFALKQAHPFDWPNVLDLCAWATSQEREVAGRNTNFPDADPHWGWTRAAVARLLGDGFSSESNPIPLGLKDLAWQAIEPITNDPEPTPEQEKEYSSLEPAGQAKGKRSNVRSFDPFTAGMNSVRGAAIESVVRYALWVRRGFEKLEGASDLLAKGFEAMPEVRKALETHLRVDIDPSIAIRTIYGQRLPWLQLLDPKWAQENTARILPRNDLVRWHAAWDTYICYCAPYDNVFDWLRSEYAFAVEQIGSHEHGWEGPQPPDFSLAQHLMTFYWRGKLAHDGDLLKTFYGRADEKLAGHALNFVGRSLRDAKEAVPEDVSGRLMRLWSGRLAAARQRPATSGQELKEYGWWFVSRKMDDAWSVSQLLEALSLAKWIEPDFLVVQELAKLSSVMPLECIRALTMIVEGDAKGWAVLGWADDAKAIIKAALKSDNPEARQSAEDLVNALGSRGYFDFGALLKETIH